MYLLASLREILIDDKRVTFINTNPEVCLVRIMDILIDDDCCG